jgi:hypothetical protein
MGEPNDYDRRDEEALAALYPDSMALRIARRSTPHRGHGEQDRGGTTPEAGDEQSRASWDAAAAAEIERLASENQTLRAERDEMRALAGEVITAYDAATVYDRTPSERDRLAKWRRQAAGLEAAAIQRPRASKKGRRRQASR